MKEEKKNVSSAVDEILQNKKHKKVQISITLDEDVLKEIKKLTMNTGLSRAEVINGLLRHDLDV